MLGSRPRSRALILIPRLRGTMASIPRFCAECGARQTGEGTFCGECGSRLVGMAEPQTVVPPRKAPATPLMTAAYGSDQAAEVRKQEPPRDQGAVTPPPPPSAATPLMSAAYGGRAPAGGKQEPALGVVPPPPPPQQPHADTMARPSVGVMWINAALFWGVLPGLYLLYLTPRNIHWAVQNRQPWLRYAMPLATLVALFVILLIWASTLPDPNSNPYGTTYP